MYPNTDHNVKGAAPAGTGATAKIRDEMRKRGYKQVTAATQARLIERLEAKRDDLDIRLRFERGVLNLLEAGFIEIKDGMVSLTAAGRAYRD
jgi:hypothetical protein